MRNPKFNFIFCICAFLSPWMLSGAEEKCVGEVLEFPGVENHRYTAPETKWLNFSFTVRDEACVTAKPFEIRVYRGNQPLCILSTASGKCTVNSGNACGCSGRAMQFTFSKKMESDDAKRWRWTVRLRHSLDEIDQCVVTLGLNPSQEPIVSSNSSEYCKNRVSSTRNIIASTLPDIITRMQAKSTSSIKTDVHRDEEQDRPMFVNSTFKSFYVRHGKTFNFTFAFCVHKSEHVQCNLHMTNSFGMDIKQRSMEENNCSVAWSADDTLDSKLVIHQENSKTQAPESLQGKCVCYFGGSPPNVSLTVTLQNDVTEQDSGNWRMTVSNRDGTDHQDFFLLVTKENKDPGEGFSLVTTVILGTILAIVVCCSFAYIMNVKKSRQKILRSAELTVSRMESKCEDHKIAHIDLNSLLPIHKLDNSRDSGFLEANFIE